MIDAPLGQSHDLRPLPGQLQICNVTRAQRLAEKKDRWSEIKEIENMRKAEIHNKTKRLIQIVNFPGGNQHLRWAAIDALYRVYGEEVANLATIKLDRVMKGRLKRLIRDDPAYIFSGS